MMACADKMHERQVPVARTGCTPRYMWCQICPKSWQNAHRGQESKRKIDREEEERREIAGVYLDALA